MKTRNWLWLGVLMAAIAPATVWGQYQRPDSTVTEYYDSLGNRATGQVAYWAQVKWLGGKVVSDSLLLHSLAAGDSLVARVALAPGKTFVAYQGLYQGYFTNGSLRDMMRFEAGRPTGGFTSFYENGRLRCRGTLRNSHCIDTLTYFHPNGRVRKSFIFDTSGWMLRAECWDTAGHPMPYATARAQAGLADTQADPEVSPAGLLCLPYPLLYRDPVVLNLDSIKRSIQYPQEAKDQGITGKVTFKIWLNASGQIERYAVMRDPHELLTNEVGQFIPHLRYTPGQLADGLNAPCTVVIPFDFRIETDSTGRRPPRNRR